MFKQRSTKKELLDGDAIPDQDLFQNLKELDVINSLLGGYSITYNALRKILTKNREYTLVDIGCGGGDTLKKIKAWGTKNDYKLKLHGIDLKQTCIHYAATNKPGTGIHFICDDYKNISKHVPNVDIIHACLFCHHLSEQELLELITFSNSINATLVINDLERNRFAYYAIKILTALFSKSYLVKNDAPLSVLRGFKNSEWKALLQRSSAKKYSVNYRWAFRHEVIVYAGAR